MPPISDSGDYDEREEAATRKFIGRVAAYAESGPEFDPAGRYLCGDCGLKQGTRRCHAVSGVISFEAGSCRLWTRTKFNGQARPKLTQIEAQYAERPEAKGFGCSPRCEYASEAKEADADGRKVWCGFWGLRVMAKTCCSEEDGKDLISAPGEKPELNEE